MNKLELIEQLNKIHKASKDWRDADITDLSPDEGHEIADRLLLKYINDEEITKAFLQIERWYA